MFTTPCFIRKNTPELRKQLEELGYTNGAWEEPHFEYPYLMCFPNRKFGLFKGEGFYMTEDDYKCDGKRWTYNPPKEYVDCGTDEHLFLSIAALRDDSDKEQWFITYKSYHSYIDYAAILCREDKWEDEYVKESQQHNFIDTKPEDYHKANVKEIIRLYKDFEEDLKDLYEYDED